MSDSAESLLRQLQTVQRELAEAQSRCERLDAERRTISRELEDNRSALMFMLEDLEAGRKEIEHAHQEWMAALDVVEDLIFLHDKEFRILRCNKAYQQCAGLSFNQIIGKVYYDIFPKAANPLPSCLRAMEKTMDEEDDDEVKVGDAIYRSRAFSVRDGKGDYLYSVHTLEDITEDKRLALAVIENEGKFRKITESAQDAIIMMGADHCISFWNSAAERIFGYTAAEAVGQELPTLIIPASSRINFLQSLPNLIATGEGAVTGKQIEAIALRKGDKEFPIEFSISATQFGGGWNAIGIVRDISERKRSEAEIAHVNRALHALSAGNKALIHANDEQQLLETMCQVIVEKGSYRMAWVGYLEKDAEQAFRVVAHAGLEDGYLAQLSTFGSTDESDQEPALRVARKKLPQIVSNVTNNSSQALWRVEAAKHGYASVASFPLMDADRCFGVLTLYAGETNAFTSEEIELLAEMSEDLAFGILTQRVKLAHLEHERLLLKNMLQTVQAIANIVEMRDPYTSGHQKRVAEMAREIATLMGLPEDQIQAIHLAGLVHDLGKIRIPTELLSKPGRLDGIEFSLIKMHAQAGYDILKDIDFSWPISEMVWQHHERVDGSGYPQGLKGDEILLGARILSVADVVEAMSSHRPYRPGLGMNVALEEIERGRGTQYDHEVVDICLSLFREHGYVLPK